MNSYWLSQNKTELRTFSLKTNALWTELKGKPTI